MKTNAELQRDVLDELLSDPTVNAANIQVAADHGAVTLGGSIASYTEKWQAKRAAQRVRGAISVINNLEVELPQADGRNDADLERAASDSLRWNKLVPPECISVTAANGGLTLTGEVPYHSQREAAYSAVRTLVGVRGANNHVRLKPVVTIGEVKAHIEKVLVRIAERDAANIRVGADGDRVTLSGSVRSCFESEEVARAAWTAPGVREVQNDLVVIP
jgi:osmotically-inducible protein OsmY